MLRRSLYLLAFGSGLLFALPTLLGQGGNNADKITFRAPDGKIVEDIGELKESPKGVEWTNSSKKTISITPEQVIRIEPTKLSEVNMPDLTKARGLEETNPGEAASAYGEMLKKAGGGASERTKRFLSYQEAFFTVKALDAKVGKEFDVGAVRAADKMNAAGKLAIKSWEVWPASRTAARLYAEAEDYPKAISTLAALGSVPELPKPLQQEANLLEAAMALRGKNPSAARTQLDRLSADASFPKAGPLRDRLEVMKVAASIAVPVPPIKTPVPADSVKKLQTAIDAAKDPAARGIGTLVLADLYAGHGMNRDAMWMYLTVDVVYNAEMVDQVVAVRRLIPIFEALGDKEKAEQFREKLPRVR